MVFTWLFWNCNKKLCQASSPCQNLNSKFRSNRELSNTCLIRFLELFLLGLLGVLSYVFSVGRNQIRIWGETVCRNGCSLSQESFFSWISVVFTCSYSGTTRTSVHWEFFILIELYSHTLFRLIVPSGKKQ